jgi:vesicle coat complex subunit
MTVFFVRKASHPLTNTHTHTRPAESSKVPKKIAALKKLIEMLLNGERFPNLLMVIIRFVMPCDDHTIKKLLHIYWEIVPKVCYCLQFLWHAHGLAR